MATVAGMVADLIWSIPFGKVWSEAGGVEIKEAMSKPHMWAVFVIVMFATAIVFGCRLDAR